MLSVARTLARRPRLWVEAARTAAAMARRGWWRRPPFLPLPDKDYLRWRIATAYGTADAPVSVADVVAYLEWTHGQR